MRFVFPVRSKLFWKILGTYVLLSTVALIGLVVTLNAQLSAQTEQLQQAEAVDLLNRICDPSESGRETSQIAEQWRQTLAARGFRLWVVNPAGQPAVAEILAEGGPQHSAVIQSTVRAAARTGSDSRRLSVNESGERVLVTARRFETGIAPAQIALMLGDPDAGLQDHRLLAQAGTRAAVFTWLIGMICTTFVATGIVGPLRSMTANLKAAVGPSQRHDTLLQISERRDELGDMAKSITLMEEDRQNRIDELQQTELESRRTVGLLSAVLNAMVEGVIAIDREERVLFLNAAASRLMGISDGIGVGRRIYEAIRVPAVLEVINEAVVSQKMQSLEFRSLRDNHYLFVVVNPIQRVDWSGAVAVFRDISEQRHVESMRRDFVSGVSHELKTPLTVIQACTDTLLEGAVDQPDDARHFLKQINTQSERLLQLVLGMLQLARVESGAEVFDPGPLNCADVVSDVLRTLTPVAAARSIRLHQAGPSELTVTADAQALQTVITNLVDNALKHTLKDGVVTVVLSRNDSGASITVMDTGCGIAREHQSRIFERFYRVDRDRSREHGGTGLGLAIVKHLCQTMGAVVSVRSEPGKGSEFCVMFPASAGALQRENGPSGR